MAIRAMMQLARMIATKIVMAIISAASKLTAFVVSLFSWPVLLGIIAAFIIIVVLYVYTSTILPSGAVMSEEDNYMLYRDQVAWLDEEFMEEIQKIKAEKRH